MWYDDLDWLELTYPVRLGKERSEAERAEEAERVCLRRLEAIWWPEGPTCPECGTCDDAAEWKEAPRGLGWRCRNCKARFHVLKAIPPMTGTHQSIPLWFRAIFLISNSENLSPSALCKRLGLQYKIAAKLHGGIRKMRAEYPDRVRRIVDGPTADGLVRRRSRKPAPATTREPSADTAGQAEPPTGSEPPTSMPGAFDPDC
jgi:hypothetical protein